MRAAARPAPSGRGRAPAAPAARPRRARISPPAPGRWRCDRKSGETSPRDIATTWPALSMTKVSGSFVVPYFGREVEPVVAQARVGQLVLLDEVARGGGVVLVGHAEHRAAAAPASLRCARSSTGASFSHGPHHEAQKFSTTTLPRSCGQRAAAPAVEHRQRHPRAGRGRPLPLAHRGVQRRVVAPRHHAVDQQPDEGGRQHGDGDGDGGALHAPQG